LLLDEPTNYLDITSISWLKGFLREYPGEIIIITHDRNFMDAVVTSVAGIHRNQFKKIKGDTNQYYEQILLEEEIYEKTRLNQEKKVKELESFVERFGAKASKASQAQSRVKQLSKINSLEKLNEISHMHLNFEYSPMPAKTLVQIKDVSFHYQEGEDLFRGISFDINKGDRIGIIGKNGKGKSTLLNVIAGELNATGGEISAHHAVKKGHFGQMNIDRLHGGHTIAGEINLANSDLAISRVRAICGAMMFTGDLADKKISVLSGGERARVQLGKILASPTNLLLLDEPTNHLDMESIEILTHALTQYEGPVAVVTHDENMLRTLATKLIYFKDGNAHFFDGNYDDFLVKVGWEDTPQSEIPTKPVLTYKEKKSLRSNLIKERSKVTSPLKKKMEKLEETIDQSERELTETNQVLLSASESGDAQKIQESSKRVSALEETIETSFEELSQVSEELETIENEFESKLSELE
jgi:ATP-binding cassette subfamily F protein 3